MDYKKMGKTTKIKISSKALANETLKHVFPEVYKLSEFVERNIWHRGETSFEHTVEVLDNLERLLLLQFIEDAALRSIMLKRLNSFLPKGARKYNRKELLLIGTVLHDIGKLETYTIKENNTTGFTGHEEKGIKSAVDIAIRLGLKDQDLNLIKDLVKYHASPNYLSTDVRDQSSEQQEAESRKLISSLGNNAFEISLLTLADFQTSNTKFSDLELFKFQKSFLTKFVLIAAQTMLL